MYFDCPMDFHSNVCLYSCMSIVLKKNIGRVYSGYEIGWFFSIIPEAENSVKKNKTKDKEIIRNYWLRFKCKI